MNNTMIRCVLALSLAAAGCSRLTIVGVSEDGVPLTAAGAAALTATAISAKPGEMLQTYDPPLGDIDGDGLDDLILFGFKAEGAAAPEAIPAYLFYGRASFPEQLSSADADATFETGNWNYNLAVGDVNGDGLGDFVLTHVDGYQLIFGRAERLSGHYAKFSDAGPVVTYPHEQSDSGQSEVALMGVHSLGDLNGDGRNELAVKTLTRDPTPENTFPLDASTDYILEGRADGWPSGAWDPSWSVAQLGTYAYPTNSLRGKLSTLAGADIDGDGYSDLMATDWAQTLVFYGKAGGLRGTLEGEHADATFAANTYPNPIGDLDGDGAADLTVYSGNKFTVTYGKRFVGDVQLQADLTFVDQGGEYGNAFVGDIDGDGEQDLVLIRYVGEFSQAELYVVRGNGQRSTGEQSVNERFQPVGYAMPEKLTSDSFVMSGGGDFDGDGSADLILTSNSEEVGAENALFLMPGSTKSPE